MISCINGFACLSAEEVPIAKAGINPGHPERGVVPVRPAPTLPEATPAPHPKESAEIHVDLKA